MVSHIFGAEMSEVNTWNDICEKFWQSAPSIVLVLYLNNLLISSPINLENYRSNKPLRN